MSGHPARPHGGLYALLLAVCLLAHSPAFAGIDIDTRGVEGELATNVAAYLSLTRYKDRDVDAALMNRLHDRIDREVREALQPCCDYQPRVASVVTPRAKGNGTVVIQIDPGPPVIVRRVDVRVTGPGADDPRFRRIIEHPTLRPGERLRHAAYEEMKSDLQRVAATYGYLDARMTVSKLIVDPAKRTASAVLEMASGVRYRFGRTTIEQHVIDESLARRYLRYKTGDPYDQTELLRTQFALDDSQYFSTVAVQPGEPDRADHTVPILITAQPNARDRYSFSAGYGTDTGPRGTLQWDRTRIGRSGNRFGVQLEASKLLQVLQATYTIPISDPAVDRFSIAATADYGIPGDLIDKDFAVGPSLTRVVGNWQYVFSVMPTHAITYDGMTTRTQDVRVSSATIGSVPSGYLGQLAPAAARRGGRDAHLAARGAARHLPLLCGRRGQRARLPVRRSLARDREGRSRDEPARARARLAIGRLHSSLDTAAHLLHLAQGGRPRRAHRQPRGRAGHRAQLRRRGVQRLRQCLRHLRPLAKSPLSALHRVLGRRRIPLAAAGRDARIRCRAAAVAAGRGS